MKQLLDMDGIAKGLGAERVGKARASAGHLGAAQLAAEFAQRFRVPAGGSRATDPEWTERLPIPLSKKTLKRLEEMASNLNATSQQVAAMLLEQAVSGAEEEPIPGAKEPTAELDPGSE